MKSTTENGIEVFKKDPETKKSLAPWLMSPNLSMGSYLLALLQLGPLPKKSRKIIVRGKGILKKKRVRNQRQVSPSNCVLGLLEAPLTPLG